MRGLYFCIYASIYLISQQMVACALQKSQKIKFKNKLQNKNQLKQKVGGLSCTCAKHKGPHRNYK